MNETSGHQKLKESYLNMHEVSGISNPISRYTYVLAHDYNGFVARSHLHLLNQVSYFQDRGGDHRDTVFHPSQILDVSD